MADCGPPEKRRVLDAGRPQHKSADSRAPNACPKPQARHAPRTQPQCRTASAVAVLLATRIRLRCPPTGQPVGQKSGAAEAPGASAIPARPHDGFIVPVPPSASASASQASARRPQNSASMSQSSIYS
ncbi:hypothetical protein PCL_08967 [Purpureocillium lilacinum]|uniref:Uncharacterized protein n=1 Tax=Purpureocillium lilacinum TaxID=33203 RepID=A0A2U3EGR1_PURLI|nr:hypothetical protein Purlil1_8276 [Purpureocillium lilacinum]PWI73691.1 hypothetical protein PCL_08967 [Purpureocillium lilacinum]